MTTDSSPSVLVDIFLSVIVVLLYCLGAGFIEKKRLETSLASTPPRILAGPLDEISKSRSEKLIVE